MIKELLKAIIAFILPQLLYISIIAIIRLPICNLTIPVGIIIYLISTILVMKYLEKNYKVEEKKKK